MSVSDWLREARADKMGPAELFPLLAQHAPKLAGAVHPSSPADRLPGPDWQPMLAYGARTKSGDYLAMVYTDAELAEDQTTDDSCWIMNANALWFLRTILRDNQLSGMVLNPQTDQEVRLDRKLTALLLREYAVVELARTGVAWAPTTAGGEPLVIALTEALSTVPVYFTQDDAEKRLYPGLNCTAQAHPWSRIWDRCMEVGADAAYLQFGYPEQVGLSRQHLAQLCGDGRQHPLDTVEDAVARSMGVANAGTICAALASLARVWVLVDPDGDFVMLADEKGGLILDLFTTSAHAKQFTSQFGNQVPSVQHVQPRSIPAPPLFALLAPKRPLVYINRGAPQDWCGSKDTLLTVISFAQQAGTAFQGDPMAALTGRPARRPWWQRLLGRRRRPGA